jgi:hypothetical protein
MIDFTLTDFLIESNLIEGIARGPIVLSEEEEVARLFLGLDWIEINDLENLVNALAGPKAGLRRRLGMDVMVGNYLPPRGGSGIANQLSELLVTAYRGRSVLSCDSSAWRKRAHWVHLQYEKLHPFMDGNGRSGRLLWLWSMGGIERAPLGFLHHFYYQTLEAAS